ncbi:MAG TPA: DUF1080 domain-containing protein [Chryseosolibacter sp.]|nr:DUF1080 domain-containing protein [Chryseosolibacter sp.]
MKYVFAFACVMMIFVSAATSQNQPDPKETEVWEPEPKVIAPGQTPGDAPSDAIVLFDGKNLDSWVGKDGKTARWTLADGAMTVAKGTGDLKTKQTYGDIQLHIEWRTPGVVQGEGQGRGNSGIFLSEKYELQVLDSYNNRTYSNGQAGSIYKQAIPMVNASKPPGAWQVYDVVFIAPRFNHDGTLNTPGRITVFHNGVLIHHNTEIKGTTEYIGKPKTVAHGKSSIRLQDHGNPTSFRNIWVREL